MSETQGTVGRNWISVREAAARAEVSRQTIHNWIALGRIHLLATDDGYRINADEFEQFLAMRRAASRVGIKVDTLQHWSGEDQTTA
jgi:excisionase family DNA binding protein